MHTTRSLPEHLGLGFRTEPAVLILYFPYEASSSTKAGAARWLTNFLVDQWPSQKVEDALDHIGQVLCTPVWGPDMLVQISRELVTSFFNGRLRNNIKVSWEDVHTTPSLGSDLIEVFGVTRFDEDDNICYILLNRYAIQTAQSIQLSSTASPGMNSGPLRIGCDEFPPSSMP